MEFSDFKNFHPQHPLQKKQITLLAGLIIFLGIATFLISNRSLFSPKQVTTSKAAELASTNQLYSFGTLMTDSTKAQQEKNAGLDTAMLEFGWDNYEPQDGVFSSTNIAQQQQAIQAYHAAGEQITLAFGAHYTPGWVFSYADSRFVNQYGVTANEPNVIFNQSLRTKMQEYMQNIVTNLGINNFTTIRITSGGDAEAILPGMTDSQNHNNSYWAYDANAQNGTNLPPSIPPNPFPGWRPGQTTYNGQSVTPAMVEQWYTWYLRALDDSVNWQIQFFKNAGFTGKFQVLTPGMGTRYSGYTNLINSYLNYNGDQTMGRGATWFKFYEYLPDRQNVVAYVSSMADGSGNNDLCQSTDVNVAINDPQTGNWSATRYISYLADRYGMQKSGENPGRSDTNSYGVQMMNTTASQMAACHFTGMYWAHDFNLYDGVSGVTLSDYHNVIAQYNPLTSATPAPTIITPTATLNTPTPGVTVTPTAILTPTPTQIPDPFPPTVIITFPANGAVINRNSNVTIQATATDNVGVTKVEFYVNNILKCSDTSTPYTCNWRVPAKPGVTYTLKSTAYDAANNSANFTETVTAR